MSHSDVISDESYAGGELIISAFQCYTAYKRVDARRVDQQPPTPCGCARMCAYVHVSCQPHTVVILDTHAYIVRVPLTSYHQTEHTIAARQHGQKQ